MKVIEILMRKRLKIGPKGGEKINRAINLKIRKVS